MRAFGGYNTAGGCAMARYEITEAVEMDASGLVIRNPIRVFGAVPFTPYQVVVADADGNIIAVKGYRQDHFHPLLSVYPPAAQYLVLTRDNRMYWLKSEDGRWYAEMWEVVDAPQFARDYARVHTPLVERAKDYLREGV